MHYLFEISRGESKQEINSPIPEQIDSAIGEMLPIIDHYIILHRSQAAYKSVKHYLSMCKQGLVKGNFYIQTCLDKNSEVENIYFVETRFVHEVDVKGKHIKFTHYRKATTDIELVKSIFRMYALDEDPDVSDWEDVTESLTVL